MRKKSKPKISSSSQKQQQLWKWLALLIPAAAVLLAAIISIVPSLREGARTPSAPPAFALANPITRPDSGLVIIAQNRSAQREEPLNVEHDGFLFANAAKRQPIIFPHAWRFTLLGRNLPDSLLTDGTHRVRVGFAGEALSEYLKVGFSTQPPIVVGRVTQLKGSPYDHSVYGKIMSKLQSPEETMFVEIVIRREREPVEIEVPVKRIELKDFIYFEFDTTLRGNTRVSFQDPKYQKSFFGIRVMDQAGNSYFHEESYAKFATFSDKQFTNLNDAELQRLPTELRENVTLIFLPMLEVPSLPVPKVSPATLPDTSQPTNPYLTIDKVNKMIVGQGLFDRYQNPSGTGIRHQYKTSIEKGANLIIDEATGRMWQEGGSSHQMNYKDALIYVAQKNEENFGGYSDWRLPTLLEAMSLMESKQQRDVFLNPVFDRMKWWVWTSDKESESSHWMVNFLYGYCYARRVVVNGYVRLVR